MTYDKSTILFKPLSTRSNFKNLANQVFGRLTVLGYGGYRSNQTYWFCECECGKVIKATFSNLSSNHTKSCGCLRREIGLTAFLVHGEYRRDNKGSPEIRAYNGAKHRCNNPKNSHYNRYGGRGIEFRFNSFEEFFAEIGLKPSPKHSVDRIDNNGHYEKGNVRWATQQEQKRNCNQNHFLTASGKTANITEWSETLLVNKNMIFSRKFRGWCDECALFQPKRGRCIHRK